MSKKNKLLLACGSIVVLIVLVLVIFLVNNQKENIMTYKIIFDSNGGSTVQEQIVNEGELVERPVDPTKDGYAFVEWRYNGVVFDFRNKVDKDITLVAEWLEITDEVEMIVVKFNTDGGSTIPNQIIEKNTKIIKPAEPTKDDYTFKGWFYDDDEFDFDTEVTEDIELVAKWEKVASSNKNSSSNSSSNTTSNNSISNNTSTNNNKKNEVTKYTVTFNSNGGSSIASQTVTAGGKATEPSNPTRSGYTFDGWTLNGSTYNFNSSVNSNITLVAKWTEKVKNNYTVIFNSNGGSSVSSQTIVEGNKATEPSKPTKEGYNFVGWTLNGSTYNFNSTVTSNITLTASWNQKTYTITATSVDAYSPDRVLTVKEDGNKISFKSIKYSDGVLLCSGTNPTVSSGDIAGEKNFKVELTGGTIVNATLN